MSSATLGSHRSATLRAPTTPHAIRQKPPPKPPRLSSFKSNLHNSSSASSTDFPPASPGGISNKSSTFGDITLDSSFGSISGSGTDLQPASRIYPCSTEDKVYHILLQTKEFLVNELDVQLLLSPLLTHRVLDTRAVKQLRNTNSKTAMADLLLDTLMRKRHQDFLRFCDILRDSGKYMHLADLLLALNGLVDLGSENSVKKRQSGSFTMENSGTKRQSGLFSVENFTYSDSTHCDNQSSGGNGIFRYLSSSHCPVCSEQQSSGETSEYDQLMDTTNFDVEIVYIDRDTGQVKPQKEVAAVKVNRLLSADTTEQDVPQELLKHEADRYIPILTVHLYNYCLWDVGMDKLKRALLNKTCIRELCLSKCHLGPDSIHTLSQTIQVNAGVSKLDLRLNNLSVECLAELCTGLRSNRSIRLLNLGSTGLTEAGCQVLFPSINRSQHISELDVGFNDLADGGCQVMAESLATAGCPLKRLRVRDNSITFDGAFRLFKALKKNSKLSFLDMSSNAIGDKALGTLSEILRYNRSLKQINLENCGISGSGCETLARALKTNTVLRQLNLNMNPVGDRGVEGLAVGLKYNQVLDVLCLNMCDITNLGFSRLLDNLQFNMSLKSLKLCYNKIGRTCQLCPTQLDCNKNKLLVGSSCLVNESGKEVTEIPSIEDIYDKLCEILQQNQDLKVLLWGNKLEEEQGEQCEKHIATETRNHDYSTTENVFNQGSKFEKVNGFKNSSNGAKSGAGNGEAVTQSLNNIQRQFVEQYTIQPIASHLNNCNSLHSNPRLPNGNPVNCKMTGRYPSDLLNTVPLTVSVPDPSTLSCGNVSRFQVSPRMGTTSASLINSLGSQPYLHGDDPAHYPRIRTNGSLPRRQKHSVAGAVTESTLHNGHDVGYFTEVSESEADCGNKESEFRPHTFPRRGQKKANHVD